MRRLFRSSLLASLLLTFPNNRISNLETHQDNSLQIPNVSEEFHQLILNQDFSSFTPEIMPKENPLPFRSSGLENLSLLMSYMSKKGFAIDTLIADKRFDIYGSIASKFTRSAEKRIKSLEEYKKLLGFSDKKERIFLFMERNLCTLEKAEEIYGIPKEFIASIFGIESDFARVKGTYNPFNVYVSMHVKSVRPDLAIPQLEELLIFCRKNNLDVLSLRSSYAGAMSYAQFLPLSLNSWFIGADLYDIDNNIMSTANYLSYFKRRTGSLEKAVYSYNPKDVYVGFVMDLAKEAKTGQDSTRQKYH